MSLKGKLESAAWKYAKTATGLPAGFEFYTGADSDEQKRPCVVLECIGGPEEPQGSGNRVMGLMVTVKGQADPEAAEDAVAAHNANVKAIFDHFKMDDLATQLTTREADFHCFDPVYEDSLDPELEGRAFVDRMLMRCYCCATRFADS